MTRQHRVRRKRKIQLCPCGCNQFGFCPEHLVVLHRLRDELSREDKKNSQQAIPHRGIDALYS